ncbi:MAG: hypothetical protein H0W36_00790 [Gemmatimonadetes bacterium]|nr:hypothetical protein [Gemmatimonadota bacterium]
MDTTTEELGFETGDETSIDAEIEGLRREIEPPVLRRFEKVAAKYDRPLVPIRNGVCYGCFVRFPTSRLAVFGEKRPATCENCGRLLYQIP